jgi:hypothetical protein
VHVACTADFAAGSQNLARFSLYMLIVTPHKDPVDMLDKVRWIVAIVYRVQRGPLYLRTKFWLYIIIFLDNADCHGIGLVCALIEEFGSFFKFYGATVMLLVLGCKCKLA